MLTNSPPQLQVQFDLLLILHWVKLGMILSHFDLTLSNHL